MVKVAKLTKSKDDVRKGIVSMMCQIGMTWHYVAKKFMVLSVLQGSHVAPWCDVGGVHVAC